MSDSRNKILSDICVKVGLTDFDDSSRNSLLDALALAYGVDVVNKTANNLLYAIDSAVHVAFMPRVSRNGHIKSIAEYLGSTTLPDGKSRNYYLEKWLEYAVSVVQVWILAGGTWNNEGYWDDTQTWNDGV